MGKQNSTNPLKIIIFHGFLLETFLNEVSWSGNCRSPAPCSLYLHISHLYYRQEAMENNKNTTSDSIFKVTRIIEIITRGWISAVARSRYLVQKRFQEKSRKNYNFWRISGILFTHLFYGKSHMVKLSVTPFSMDGSPSRFGHFLSG